MPLPLAAGQGVCELSSISVLYDLVNYFGCGTVYRLQSNAARYQVQSVEEMLDKIYPKLKDIKFNTIKQNHFALGPTRPRGGQKTIKVAEFIKSHGYKTDEGLKTIVDMAWDMNKEGKGRKINKSEYLLKFISYGPSNSGEKKKNKPLTPTIFLLRP